VKRLYRRALELAEDRTLVRNVAIGGRPGSEITLTKFPLEQFERHSIDGSSSRGVVTGAFVTHKGVRPVKLMPAKIHIRVRQRIVDNGPSLSWHVWVLAAKNNQQLPFNIRDSVE
jgi:hypothetical protein